MRTLSGTRSSSSQTSGTSGTDNAFCTSSGIPIQYTWDLVKDWRNAPDQLNPSPDAHTVFRRAGSDMASGSLAHDPAAYPSCSLNDWPDGEQWNDPRYLYLLVGHDSAASTTVRMHSYGGKVVGFGYDSIVRWESPVAGRVDISGPSNPGDPACNHLGSGIIWSVDKGWNTALRRRCADRRDSDFTLSTMVEVGDVLYFVHDPGYDSSCDTARALQQPRHHQQMRAGRPPRLVSRLR